VSGDGQPSARASVVVPSDVRIVLAEDEGMIRDAFAKLLALEPGIEVVAHVGDGAAALAAVREYDPDVLVTDIEMPEMTGLALAEAVRDGQLRTRVLVLTTFARPGYLRRALQAEVAGYVLKAAPIDELVQAIRTIHAGGRVVAPELAVLTWDSSVTLTDRERDVLRLAERGLPNDEIASTLHLAKGTVRNYLSDAMGKLGARTRTEAANAARDRGLL
jgi:two-component system, NarL family, response regulator DesR